VFNCQRRSKIRHAPLRPYISCGLEPNRDRMKHVFESIAREIEEIERKWRAVLREASGEVMLPARWSYCGGILRWHVLLGGDIVESDVDVEITSAALIVRARSGPEESNVLLGLLPVPATFDVCAPEISFESDTIEIVVYPIGGDDR